MPYSEVIHGSTTFELTKGKQKFKKMKTIHIDVLDLPSFSSLQCPWQSAISTHTKLVVCVLEKTVIIADFEQINADWV